MQDGEVNNLLRDVPSDEQHEGGSPALLSIHSGIQLIDHLLCSDNQRTRIAKLLREAVCQPYANPHPTTLFPVSEELMLGLGTTISDGITELGGSGASDEVLLQLLPYWIETAQGIGADTANIWGQILLGKFDISSCFPQLLNRIRLAKERIAGLSNSRSTQFSRSAHYMGSKASLAPYLSEIIHTLLADDTVVLDLMCGSGAAAGYFAREWKTYASDAQAFSRLLAKVQGGGMDSKASIDIADKVLEAAREHFEHIPKFILENIEVESEFLSAELSDDVRSELHVWISNYPRINTESAARHSVFEDLVRDRASSNDMKPYLLFSAYYANLFFGVRQAAEIDSLRYAIDRTLEGEEHEWAMGALVCAVSSCAYSYGGHFAQPKVDGADRDRLNILAPELMVTRAYSVSHEFFVRLTSLGEESSKIKFPVGLVQGTWEQAIDEISSIVGHKVCVYLDPPYTRDEYSRYYHVLETLVRYDYPAVQDKASMPKRGDAGRFASDFATRNISKIEDLIVEIISVCLRRKWSCLWSYSSTGVASIEKILRRVSCEATDVHIFNMAHSYKGQGKHKSKSVTEYAILIKG